MSDLRIPFVIDSLDAAPEPLRMFFLQGADGKYHAQFEGDPPDGKRLKEFRDSNRALNTTVTTLQGQLKAFEGIDPDAAKADRIKLTDLETSLAAEKAAADALKTQHAAALAAVTAEQTTRAAELETALTAEKTAHAKTQFRHTIALPFLTAGGQDTAVDFAVALAEKTFAIADGAIVTEQFSARTPGVKLGVGEWIAQQVIGNPYLFKPGTGGPGPMPNTGTPAPKRTISGADPYAFGENLADIAAGNVTVS
jgi:hypothetical protein